MHVLLTTEEQSLKSFIDLSKDHSHMAMFVNAKLLTIKTTRCFHHKVIKRPSCQICGKTGHAALDCYHRMDYAYQGKQPPTKLAAMAATSNAQHSDKTYWLSDTGATDHFTPDLTTIPDHQDYAGGDLATVGNGHALPITHIGRAGPERALTEIEAARAEIEESEVEVAIVAGEINGYEKFLFSTTDELDALHLLKNEFNFMDSDAGMLVEGE
uniref:CCHC-type domain-containing protein n=1 Tax=Fagus sylvatica TaxID=28930 RepID=A0A2N9I2I2_FAGSY